MEMDTPSTTLGSWFNAVLRGILIVISYPIGVAMLIYYFVKFDVLKIHLKTKPR